MSCENYGEMLSCYIDNELEQAERLELENHLSTCKKCSQQVKDLMSIKKSMAGLETCQVPLNFHSELMRKINPRKKQKPKYLYYMGFAASIMIGFFIYDGILPENEITQPQPVKNISRNLSNIPVADIPQATETTNKFAMDMPVKFNGIEINLFQDKEVSKIVTDLINFANEQNLSYIDLSEPTRLYWIISSVENYNIIKDYISSIEYLQTFDSIIHFNEDVNSNEDIKIIIYR